MKEVEFLDVAPLAMKVLLMAMKATGDGHDGGSTTNEGHEGGHDGGAVTDDGLC